MKETMYDKLLQLPLFQGLCEDDITNILEKVKLHFNKHNKKHIIIEQGKPCDKLYFVLEGDVKAKYTDKQYGFSLEESFEGPYIIEPYSMFGMYPYLSATYTTEGVSSTMTIDKSYILTQLNKYEIFNLNFLNILSNRAQTIYYKLWNTHQGNTEEKIINFIVLRCSNPTGPKNISIKMEVLAGLINDTRINVSRALNKFQKMGMMKLSRKVIIIPELETLTHYIDQQNKTDK